MGVADKEQLWGLLIAGQRFITIAKAAKNFEHGKAGLGRLQQEEWAGKVKGHRRPVL